MSTPTKFTLGPWEIKDSLRIFGPKGMICEVRVPLANDPETDEEWESDEVMMAHAEAVFTAKAIVQVPAMIAAIRGLLSVMRPKDWRTEEGAFALRTLWDAAGAPTFLKPCEEDAAAVLDAIDAARKASA